MHPSQIFARPLRMLSRLGLACALSACTADISSEPSITGGDDESLSSFAEGATVDDGLSTDTHANILSASASGSCKGALVSTFDGIVDVIPTADLAKESCRIRVDLEVPAGYRMSLPQVQVDLSDAMVRSRAKWVARQKFVGQSHVTKELVANAQNADSVSWQVFPRSTPVSSSCRSSRVSYELELSARNFDFSPLDRVLLPFRYDRGTRLTRCGGGAVVPPASAVDGFCGGAPQHACVEGLVCDRKQLVFDESGDGRCVDPSVTPEPAPYKELCGGPQHRGCAEGLTCSYVSAESQSDARVHGVCLGLTSTREEPCGGHPSIGCEDGLTCWRSDLAVDAPFGNCRPTVGQVAGDVCGGTPALDCAEHLSCAGGACLRTDGEVGARCGVDGLTCNGELTCFHNSCQDWTAFPQTAQQGEKCGVFVQKRCLPELTCGVLGVCN